MNYELIKWGEVYMKRVAANTATTLVEVELYSNYFLTVSTTAATSATAAVSVESATTATSAVTVVSVTTESVASAALSDLLQEKSEALNTTASNKTNFFISFLD